MDTLSKGGVWIKVVLGILGVLAAAFGVKQHHKAPVQPDPSSTQSSSPL